MKKTSITILVLAGFVVGSLTTAVTLAASSMAQRLAGRILLQVESMGEAWYVDPVSLDRYYLGRPADCFDVMRGRGLGITNNDLSQITIANDSALPDFTADWITYTGDFLDPNKTNRRIIVKHPARFHSYDYGDGDLPDLCATCSVTLRFIPQGPGSYLYGLDIIYSAEPLSLDTSLLTSEYVIARSVTDNTIVTLDIVDHNLDVYPSRMQAVTSTALDGIYYKFDFTFNAGVDNKNLEDARRTFQEILNSFEFEMFALTT